MAGNRGSDKKGQIKIMRKKGKQERGRGKGGVAGRIYGLMEEIPVAKPILQFQKMVSWHGLELWTN
jgi:hypothetical protein